MALVIRDQSEFGWRAPVVIGTPSIDWVVWVLKESEMETIPEEWQRVQQVHEFVHSFFAHTMNPAKPMPTNTNQNPLDLDEKVFLKGKCTIPGFEFVVVQGQTHWTMMMGYQLNIMT